MDESALSLPGPEEASDTLRILVLGMYNNAMGELSYEARMVHHLASIPGNEVDYWTDSPLSYSMEPVLRQPQNLRSFVFHEGKEALAKTPRALHPLDLKRIIIEHMNPRMKWLPKLKIENISPMGTDIQMGTIFDPEKIPKPYDVIFTTAQTGIDMGIPLKQILDIPLVVQILDVPWWRITQYGPYEIYKNSVIPLPLLQTQLFEGYAQEWQWWLGQLSQVDRVTTILEEAKKYVVGFSGVDPSKVSVTWHGSIDQDTFDYYIEREKVERKNQVICINRIDFHKGVDQTVLVCKMIQDMMGEKSPNFIFVSQGNQKWYEDAVKGYALRIGLRNYRFTGWVDNPTKIRLIRESKVMLDNEWPNGFGGCNIGEAIYCGCVPIVWDVPSKRECYPTGPVFVPHGNYQEMASVAKTILENETEYLTHPQAFAESRTFVRSFRSNRSHAESVDKVLREVVGK